MAAGDVWGNAWGASWGASWADALAPAVPLSPFLEQASADLLDFFTLGLDAPLAADLAVLMADFGLTCTHAGSDDFSAILDAPYTDELSIEGRAYVLTARTVDLALIAEDDTVVIGGTSYRAKTQKPDGTGISELMLEAI